MLSLMKHTVTSWQSASCSLSATTFATVTQGLSSRGCLVSLISVQVVELVPVPCPLSPVPLLHVSSAGLYELQLCRPPGPTSPSTFLTLRSADLDTVPQGADNSTALQTNNPNLSAARLGAAEQLGHFYLLRKEREVCAISLRLDVPTSRNKSCTNAT